VSYFLGRLNELIASEVWLSGSTYIGRQAKTWRPIYFEDELSGPRSYKFQYAHHGVAGAPEGAAWPAMEKYTFFP
jgi:hypothetical protein